MQNVLSVLLLISAIFTCLALGVGMAYGMCNLLFACMKLRSLSRTSAPTEVASIARV